MAKSVFWLKHKYKLSGLILILPLVFLYQSLSPSFPPAWPSQQLGEFKIAPMPLDLKSSYKHHGDYVKDFMLIFEQGDVAHIRQAYANIGPVALPLEALQKGENGVLHGSKHGQHVHAITGAKLAATDSLWVSIQNWQGEWLVSQWPVPEAVLVQ